MSAIASPVEPGLFAHVMPVSLQPVVVGVTTGPSPVPEEAQSRSVACRTVPLRPDRVNERYDSTCVPEPPSTRSAVDVPKFDVGPASSTRASAVGPKTCDCAGVVAVTAGLG